MSDLIVFGYENHQQAEAAYNEVLNLEKSYIVSLEGLALVDVDAEGKTHVETPGKIVGGSAAGGALWGTLIGLLFFVPFLGAAIGGAMGALFGKLGKSGIDETFRSQVREVLRPGTSGVVMMASKMTEDRFAAAMAPYGGTLLKTSLSEEDEKELASELRSGAAAG